MENNYLNSVKETNSQKTNSKILEKNKALIQEKFERINNTDAMEFAVNNLRLIKGDMYSNVRERFIFELLQNADDKPINSQEVSVYLKFLSEHLLFTHSGLPFDEKDVESICKIGRSTKYNDAESIGYKGIGFKSIFALSETVSIHSGGFSFKFDKHLPLYKDKDIKEIPWEILPIWQEEDEYPEEVKGCKDFFSHNVGISLKVDERGLNDCKASINKIKEEPLFLLFLRNLTHIKIEGDRETIDIKKEKNKDWVALKIGERLHSSWVIKHFKISIPDEVKNHIPDNENIPERLKKTEETQISFAAEVDNKGQIIPVKDSVLYTYLPTSVQDFGFKFLVNADFLLKADREGLHYNWKWNQFLFKQIGEKLIDWLGELSIHKNYLDILPAEYLKEGAQHLELSPYFNEAIKKAMDSSCFILNDKEELLNRANVLIDETGLSEIIGSDFFYKLLGTHKRLPSKSISSKILKREIFEIEQVEDKVIIEKLKHNIVSLASWYEVTDDENKNKLNKWLVEKAEKYRNDCKEIACSLPVFSFSSNLKSFNDLSDNDIVITKRLVPIKEILEKLGYSCSDNIFDEEQFLNTFIELKPESSLFEELQQRPIRDLEANEKHLLFNTLKDFDRVGEEKCKAIALFNSLEGKPAALKKMLPFRANIPEYLKPYMICGEEYTEDLNEYLINPEKEFSTIVLHHIDKVLEYISIQELYEHYQWTDEQYTIGLINTFKLNNHRLIEMIEIIEKSSERVKKYFLSTIRSIGLLEGHTYDKDSFEYRAIKLAIEVNEHRSFLDKVFYNNRSVRDFSVKDEVFCKYIGIDGKETKIVFSLSELLPQYKGKSDVINKIKALFKVKEGLDKFFEAKNKPPFDITREIHELTGTSQRCSDVKSTALQYLYITYYYREVKKPHSRPKYDNDYIPNIKLENNTDEYIADLMNFLFENKIDIQKAPFTYHLRRYFDNKYFDNEYIFLKELLLPAIESWANTDEKKKYLTDNGIKKADDYSIRFRELLIENKPIDFIDKLNDKEINTGLEYIIATQKESLPFKGEHQLNIIDKLRREGNFIKGFYDTERLQEKGEEWNDSEYFKWKENKGIQIYLYPTQMPYYHIYDKIIITEYHSGDYFAYQNILYLNKEKDIENLLWEITKDETINIFTNEGYEAICRKDKVLISEKEKEELEILRKEKEENARLLAEKDEEIAQLKEALIKREIPEIAIEKIEVSAPIKRNTSDSNMPPPVIPNKGINKDDQVSNNKEAQEIIKERLMKDGYDCSNWDIETEDFELLKTIRDPQGNELCIIIKSAKGESLYLSAYELHLLKAKNNSRLMIWNGKEVDQITAEELFKKNSDIYLKLDAENTPEEMYIEIANLFEENKSIKGTQFIIKNPVYDAYEATKGLDNKVEGEQNEVDDNDL